MTAKDRVLAFLKRDAEMEDNRPTYLGCTNGVIERETKLNGNTIRKVLGQLQAEGVVRATTQGSTLVYRA